LCADDPKEQIEEKLFNRSQDFKARRGSQIQTVEFPTTTIGSFPQTTGELSLAQTTIRRSLSVSKVLSTILTGDADWPLAGCYHSHWLPGFPSLTVCY